MKFFIFHILIISSNSTFSQNKDDDQILVKEILNKICLVENNGVFISQKADNEYFLDIYKENLNDSVLLKSFKKTDTVTYINREVVREIFTPANFEYVKKQTGKYTWNKDKIKLPPNCNISFEGKYKNRLFISKPVYTKNDYALVYYTYKNMIVLLIFKREGEEWLELEFIPIGMV
ncbi:hypothetical protein GCM10007424_27860 [Flavobacterium suaedae]|uniref:Uncharacterized protein n=1 Tax=Flavobacterium suaedae TaxID=1767027 RepID=A0ABQ1K386_9FLAO|nr:hypothetical protein [Flavobacterium suaedae]GGB86224.1 hypothetical protein GCM10007424_27860 [Flavobacterium suaedae]